MHFQLQLGGDLISKHRWTLPTVCPEACFTWRHPGGLKCASGQPRHSVEGSGGVWRLGVSQLITFIAILSLVFYQHTPPPLGLVLMSKCWFYILNRGGQSLKTAKSQRKVSNLLIERKKLNAKVNYSCNQCD